jgi:hypothetical protein
MSLGGVLGVFCSHPYPHASLAAASSFPKALRGIDMALFSVLQSLGLKVKVLPILEASGYDTGFKPIISSLNREESVQARYSQSSSEIRSYKDDEAKKAFVKFQRTGKMTKKVNRYSESHYVETGFYLKYSLLFDDFDDSMDLESRWKTLLLARFPLGLGLLSGSRVGTDLHPYRIRDAFADGDKVCYPAGILNHGIC